MTEHERYDPLPEPELQIVPPTPEHKEVERWPAWIIRNPPIDGDGHYAPQHVPEFPGAERYASLLSPWTKQQLSNGSPFTLDCTSPTQGSFQITVNASNRVTAVAVADDVLRGTDAMVIRASGKDTEMSR